MLPRTEDGSPEDGNNNASEKSGKVVAAAAAITATGALASAAGCILPFALPAVALAGAGSIVAWLVQAQGWMMNLALVAVTSGWIWGGWLSLKHRSRPALSTVGAMAAATLALALAGIWPVIEPAVVALTMS